MVVMEWSFHERQVEGSFTLPPPSTDEPLRAQKLFRDFFTARFFAAIAFFFFFTEGFS